MAFSTAFQANAFQSNAFQIAAAVTAVAPSQPAGGYIGPAFPRKRRKKVPELVDLAAPEPGLPVPDLPPPRPEIEAAESTLPKLLDAVDRAEKQRLQAEMDDEEAVTALLGHLLH